MARLSITLPDDLHEQIKRIAATSNVSAASTVRTILSDIVPRMSSVFEYLGSAPQITPADVDEADVWLRDLKALQKRAPEAFLGTVNDFDVDPLPSPGRDD